MKLEKSTSTCEYIRLMSCSISVLSLMYVTPKLPCPLPKVKGQRLQKQACLDGIHPQGQGREDSYQGSLRPDGGPPCQEQGQCLFYSLILQHLVYTDTHIIGCSGSSPSTHCREATGLPRSRRRPRQGVDLSQLCIILMPFLLIILRTIASGCMPCMTYASQMMMHSAFQTKNNVLVESHR